VRKEIPGTARNNGIPFAKKIGFKESKESRIQVGEQAGSNPRISKRVYAKSRSDLEPCDFIMKPLLIEIGTEEIPARFIPGGIGLFKKNLALLLSEANIEFGELCGFATPRRLAVYIEKVSRVQKERKTVVFGPPKKIAYDDRGNLTKAALGFAKAQNIDPHNLRVSKTDRGEYVSATIEEPGRETQDVLAGALPELISSLQFPKSMRWGTGSLRFVRPIKWITAIFNGKKISFEIDGITSSDMTRGHRFMSPGAFKINDPSSYSKILFNNFVIADPLRRKQLIKDEISKLESAMKFKVMKDDELLETVTYLVEYPSVIPGSFSGDYLSLPKDLLTTVLKSHQKYFSVEDQEGNLLPHFIAVSNSNPENNETVIKGAERVLRARLEDARFYFNEDSKKPLGDRVDELKGVTFQEKLGSIHDKAIRISSICTFLVEQLNITGKEKVLRAAMLSKADLVTGVVREFPELQGYMGMVYAKASNEEKEVALSIYEHYFPRFSGDLLPSNDIGMVVSLADKMDNIASMFRIGMIPTGSEDPYGLRRQAIGILNMLQNMEHDISLNMIIKNALRTVEVHTPSEEKTLTRDILAFFYQRLEGMLISEGYSYDLVNSVLPSYEEDSGHNIKDICNRIRILSSMKKQKGFSDLLTAAKRVCNILAQVETYEIKEEILSDDAEKDLYNAALKTRGSLLETGYQSLFELTEPINIFFDSVLVMDKDDNIRQNRLALLSSVKGVFERLCDFSKIVEQSP
jgi:glycyl-tRNA synthetase beta chain